ncbi:uncharacterized protein LOC119996068 [Tripterygium wilfordii]|uniref:uncharacterized protein LOC119996068 n=1 Tax=Tripterygium wilfordii TaxID=458696 RepID=UPI0018F85935|nr:uncharacterized protein LOC119996068 [Tripterygium wilfordii]
MQNDKLCSLCKAMETNDGCVIVIELNKDDPLFNKKKSLLHNRGFKTKEYIPLNRSECHESISDTLEKMLQIARIISLNEVELYFSEVDVSSSVKFYSVKNEVEALNSILSLVKNMLSNEKHMEMDVLRDLQNEIGFKLQEVGDKFSRQTSFDRSYSCDKEKCLVQWGENNGLKTRLEIAYVKGAGRGAIVTEDLKVGDVALEVPVSIIISEELVYKSDMYNVLEKIDGISSETMLLLWSMKEKHNCSSKFKMYFDTLPENFNTGLSFGVDAIMALDGTLLLEEIMQAKEHLRTQYDELVPQLCKNHPDIFPPTLYTWEEFLWACELWYSNSMKVMFAEGKLRTCLIPIAGFLNHSLCPHILNYGRVDSATNSLKFPLSRPCRAGEQCFLSYGNLSSSHLTTFYGFLPEGDNPYDVIPLDIDIDQVDCVEASPLSNWSNHMVRGTWLSKNHDMFYYGLPSPLLDYLRRARGAMLHTETCLQAKLKIEIEVLEDLQSTFSSMMENLGDTDADVVNRENLNWDVMLALEFKDRQSKIISSILNSCDAGLKLLENELSKCTMSD